MNVKRIATLWREQAKNDFATAEILFKNRRYAPCLFFVHLSLEKELKAIVATVRREAPPYTHDLVTLAERATLPLSDKQKDFLREVNTFNIRARYDDYKLNFYKRATAAYAKRSLELVEAFILWLKKKH